MNVQRAAPQESFITIRTTTTELALAALWASVAQVRALKKKGDPLE